MTFEPVFAPDDLKAADAAGDRRDGKVYVYNKDIELAVRTAVATGRPLLVRGKTGSGKSSLARNVARLNEWRYYEHVVTSRTQARDLLWEVDHLRRLQDAHARELDPDIGRYIRPGVFWWAFNRQSAQKHAKNCLTACADPDPSPAARSVVLIDEIDKADPDMPNNLLVPLGSFEFQIEETAQTVQLDRAAPPLVIITTNDERELPTAFLRRCIDLEIEPPQREELIAIAFAHFKELGEARITEIYDQIINAKPASWPKDAVPSPAEFIDSIRAVNALKKTGYEVASLVVWKESQVQKASS